MKKVGILVGREKTFPLSLIESINERGGGEVVARRGVGWGAGVLGVRAKVGAYACGRGRMRGEGGGVGAGVPRVPSWHAGVSYGSPYMGQPQMQY